jgi:hypothetical protein
MTTMQSKNKKPMTTDERFHVERVKSLPCSVCDSPGPSAAHEIKQGQWFTAIALCQRCHQHPRQGWHGERAIWKLRKMNELDALAVTIRRVTTENKNE